MIQTIKTAVLLAAVALLPASLCCEAAQPKVVASGLDSLALSSTGQVYGWGNVVSGAVFVPVTFTTIGSVVDMAAGQYHILTLGSDGQVAVRGDNAHGQLGNNTSGGSRNTFALVAGLTNITAISAGQYYTLALKGDGTVWAWGDNTNGQLGIGSSTQQNVPVQVPGLSGVIKIATGAGSNHSMAITSDGTVWAWGLNADGQLGDNTTTSRNTPQQVANLAGAIDIGTGRQISFALLSDGTVWSWGYNGSQELGSRGTSQRLMPGPVYQSNTTPLSGVIRIAIGEGFGFATKADGSVWAWGSGSYGSHGDGISHLTNKGYATQVNQLQGMAVTAGGNHGLGLHDDGTVWAWGRGFAGEIGDNTPINPPSQSERDTPIPVHGVGNVGYLSLKPGATSFWLNVVVTTGGGTVTSSVGNISCDVMCNASYPAGTSVTLTAVAAPANTFSGWSGACSGTGACVVTMDALKSVKANYTHNSYTFSVMKAGSGSGTVTAININCGTTCTALIPGGLQSGLNATPAAGSVFAGWSNGTGDTLCTGTGSCNFTLYSNSSIVATFIIPNTAPSAPVLTAITPGDTQATLHFQPPQSNGGAIVTGYTGTCTAGASTVTATSAKSPLRVSGLVNGTLYSCNVKAGNSVGLGAASNSVSVTPDSAAALVQVGAFSRKTHGTAGTFDLPIRAAAIAGALTVEPRIAGAGHLIVFQFNSTVTSIGAVSVTDENGIALGAPGATIAGSDVLVSLGSIADSKRVSVTVNGVNGALNANANLGFLVGDVNATRRGDDDLSAIKAHSGEVSNGDNFLLDIDLSGRINAADIAASKARRTAVLP